MAQIRIREKDNTGSGNAGSTTNYIAICDAGAALGKDKVILLTGKNIKTVLENATNKDRIKELYDLGGQILIVNSWSGAKDYLLDRNQCDVKFLLTHTDDSEANLAICGEIAATRRDCAVIYGMDGSFTWSKTAKGVVDTALPPTSDTFLSEETYGVYGKYIIPVDAANLKAKETEVPAEFMWMNAYLTSIKNGNAEWLAVAGSSRGAASISDLSCGPVTESTLNTIQGSEASTYSINPVLTANPWGVRIWGTRTALPIQKDDEGNAKIVASNFANIRVLLCDLKKRLYKASKKYQFDQNTDVLWVQFKSYVNTLLDEMKLSYGIAGYRWQKITEGVANNKLACTLQIVPVEPVDDFDITIDLSDTLTVTE